VTTLNRNPPRWRFGFIIRHDWLIDNSLSLLQLGMGDVSTCVQVGIERNKITMRTRKTTPITRTQKTTNVAKLGCIVGLNPSNFNSRKISLVFDKELKLSETPISNSPIHSFSKSCSFANVSQVFHNNQTNIIASCDNFLANDMVNSPNETIFSSRNPFEESSGTSSAFSHKFFSKMSKPPFNFFNMSRPKESVIGCNSEIFLANVDAKNFSLDIRVTNIDIVDECESEVTFFLSEKQKTFFDFPVIEVSPITVRNNKVKLLSTVNGRNTQLSASKRSRTRKVVTNRTLSDDGISFGFLNNPTSLFNTGYGQLRRQTFPQFIINKGVEFDIVFNFHSPSNINTSLQTSFIGFNGFTKFRSYFNFNGRCNTNIHRKFSNSNYLNFSNLNLERQFLQPMNWLVSLPARI